MEYGIAHSTPNLNHLLSCLPGPQVLGNSILRLPSHLVTAGHGTDLAKRCSRGVSFLKWKKQKQKHTQKTNKALRGKGFWLLHLQPCLEHQHTAVSEDWEREMRGSCRTRIGEQKDKKFLDTWWCRWRRRQQHHPQLSTSVLLVMRKENCLNHYNVLFCYTGPNAFLIDTMGRSG